MAIGTNPNLLPLKVLGYRSVTPKQGQERQILVQWEILSDAETTCEPLEDKVDLNEGGSDMTQLDPLDFNNPHASASPIKEAKEKSIAASKPTRKIQEPNWMRDFSI